MKRQSRRAVVIDYADEWQLKPTAESLLRDVAAASGGIYNTTPEQIFAESTRTVIRVTPLWRTFVFLAIWLFVVDVGFRRWLSDSI